MKMEECGLECSFEMEYLTTFEEPIGSHKYASPW